jgi:hypothetical protein
MKGFLTLLAWRRLSYGAYIHSGHPVWTLILCRAILGNLFYVTSGVCAGIICTFFRVLDACVSPQVLRWCIDLKVLTIHLTSGFKAATSRFLGSMLSYNIMSDVVRCNNVIISIV